MGGAEQLAALGPAVAGSGSSNRQLQTKRLS
jgi:hypothetical protein